MWYWTEPKPQDRIRVRCDKTSDDSLFQIGKTYDGFWRRQVNDDGQERVKPYYAILDEHGEHYGTYRSPWFEFTIVEGLTEPPKE